MPISVLSGAVNNRIWHLERWRARRRDHPAGRGGGWRSRGRTVLRASRCPTIRTFVGCSCNPIGPATVGHSSGGQPPYSLGGGEKFSALSENHLAFAQPLIVHVALSPQTNAANGPIRALQLRRTPHRSMLVSCRADWNIARKLRSMTGITCQSKSPRCRIPCKNFVASSFNAWSMCAKLREIAASHGRPRSTR
jgi:hypothetical protein